MSIETEADLRGLQHVGRAVAVILAEMQAATRPGLTTAALDAVGESAMRRLGVRSAPRITYGFPGYTCISVNDEIVHGVPGARRLSVGDVVKIDVTAEAGGYVADAARTVIVGTGSALAARLRRSAKEALSAALRAARAGERVSAIGRAVERQARQDGFAVVRELCGHGVGRTIHEDPEVPNFENRWQKDVLSDGLVLAVEPMVTAVPARAVKLEDGWTIASSNGALAVHEEHTIVIWHGAPLILTRTDAPPSSGIHMGC
jgi:methionyl aminopeptidase